jgi:ABC-type multidrug transport system ATPase subunit
MNAVEISGVSKTYPGNPSMALDGVGFSVSNGEIVGVIGPNGAGKTTLGLIICGLLTPSSGSISIFGEDALTLKWHISKKYIASYFASSRLNEKFYRLSGHEYLKMMAF